MRPDRPADAHAVLGVQPGASRAEIRRAYRRRALEIHPDVAGTASTADMTALNDARDQLLKRAPGRRVHQPQDGREPADRHHRQRPATESAYDHAPTWDDYWAAWNDPPRRPKP